MNRFRFTIIELLVVIAIISILAGILFPVMGKIRAKGWKTSCKSNLRQLGVAVTAYAGNNQETMPVCNRVGEGPDDPFVVSNVLEVSSKSAFHCPADNIGQYEGKTYFARYGSSYEWNTFMNGRKTGKTNIGIGEIEISSPMMSDAEGFHAGLGKNYLYPDGRVVESMSE